MKYNDQGIINLIGAIISQAENDIKAPWPKSGCYCHDRSRWALDAIHFFSGKWFKKLAMGSDEEILKQMHLREFFKDQKSKDKLLNYFL